MGVAHEDVLFCRKHSDYPYESLMQKILEVALQI
jgi:hypothetical protein